MKHEAVIVEGSVKHTSVDGVAFTMRCCGDVANDRSAHIQDAGHLEELELRMKIETLLREHAEAHHRGCGAKRHVENLAGGKLVGCCGRDTH